VLSGVARGLVGVVGLPLSGALEAVGAVSAGIAGTVGVGEVQTRTAIQQARETVADDVLISPARLMRTLPPDLLEPLSFSSYLGHCSALTVLFGPPDDLTVRPPPLNRAVLLLCDAVFAVLVDSGATVALASPMSEVTIVEEDFRSRSVTLRCPASAVRQLPVAAHSEKLDKSHQVPPPVTVDHPASQLLTVTAAIEPRDWDSWLPLIRRCFQTS
jgi:hypothetical protein